MLDPEDLVWVRNQIGDKTPPTDTELHTRYDALGDRALVAKEVLDRRLANLLAAPATFSVAGEYSQSNDANIRELQAKIAGLGGSTGAGALSFAVLHRPGRR